MNKSSVSLAVGMSLVSLFASANGLGPTGALNAAGALSGAIRIAGGLARDAGLQPEKYVISQAPPTPQSAAATNAEDDEWKVAIRTLVATSKPKKNGNIPETLVALGIEAPFDSISVIDQPRSNPDNQGNRYFSVVSFSGDLKILIDRFSKSENILRSYLLSMDGALLSAAITRKKNGQYYSDPIQRADAHAGYEELLGFWVQYYHDNLKGKEQITARN